MKIEIEVNVKNDAYYDPKAIRKSASLNFESEGLTPEALNSATSDAARKLAASMILSAIIERWQIERADEKTIEAAKDNDDA